MDEEPLGVAIRPASGSLRPLFVSPGSGVDLASAERIVRGVVRQAIATAPLLGRSLQPAMCQECAMTQQTRSLSRIGKLSSLTLRVTIAPKSH